MDAASFPRVMSVLVALVAAASVVLTPTGAARTSSALSITTVTPTSSQTVSGKITWQVNATNSAGPIDHVAFLIDGVHKWTEWLSPYVFDGDTGQLDTTGLADGPHTLQAIAYDKSGNSVTTSVQVKVANGAPTLQVAITQPANGQTLAGKVPWVASVSGAAATRVTFAIDGLTRWTEFLAPYVFNGDGSTLDTTTLSNGTHVLTATAYSADGHSVSASVPAVIMNGTAPAVTPLGIAPLATTAPAISGTPQVGSTLTASVGTWSGSLPIAYAFAWQRCSSSSCISIAGATSASYPPASSDVGSTLRVVVTGNNPTGSAAVTSAPTAPVQSSGTTPLTDTHTWAYWANLPAPAFTPKRTIVVTSRAAFDTAWSNLQAGDLLDVRGVVFSGELALSKQLPDWAEVHFDASCKATGTDFRSRLPAVWLNNVQKVRFFGLDITNPTGGPGLTIYNGDAAWWDFKIHDTASGGGGVFAVNNLPAKVDLRGEIWRTGLDTWFDTHQEVGSGLHGFYLADDRGPVSGRVILNVHDQPTGAGVEVGPGANGLQIALLAQRMTFDSFVQVGGNALQFWSYINRPMNVTVSFLQASDCEGRAVDTNGMSTSANVRVEYGRATNMVLNTKPGNSLDSSPVGRIVWDTRGGITYGDVGPTP